MVSQFLSFCKFSHTFFSKYLAFSESVFILIGAPISSDVSVARNGGYSSENKVVPLDRETWVEPSRIV